MYKSCIDRPPTPYPHRRTMAAKAESAARLEARSKRLEKLNVAFQNGAAKATKKDEARTEEESEKLAHE